MSTKQRVWLAYIVGLVLVLALWHQVFVMTGILWWNAPPPAEQITALEPVRLAAPETSHVDVEAFLQTHPQWRP